MKPSRAAYAGAIFLGAALLFLIQPLIAKSILPWFGGSAAVWTTCLCFFQVALVAGYGYAYWLSRLTGRWQGGIHLALLAAALAFLPVLPSTAWKPAGAGNPAIPIAGLLVSTVGLPYLLLAATSPLLQTWYAGQTGGSVPWRFFALSNAGSMLGLLAYPVVVEPWLNRRAQAWMWSAGYMAFALLCAGPAWRARLLPAAVPSRGAPIAEPDRLAWIVLAACPSALLLAVTAHLTENVAAIPFLWILPLALYLISFILCFESSRWYSRRLFLPLAAAALPAMASAISENPRTTEPGGPDLRLAIVLFSAASFAIFMVCHGELAARRPSVAGVTRFYLTVAAGGALGGLLVAVAAPALLNALYDLPIVLALTAFLLVWLLWTSSKTRTDGRLALVTLAAGAATGFAFVVARDAWQSVDFARVLARNFYGSIVVYDDQSPGDMGPVRILRHGAIEHGEQFLWPRNRRVPAAYYSHNSGVGLALDTLMRDGPIAVGVVGLGAGTLFAYSRPGDRYVAYEINPAMLRIAGTEFTFLADSPAARELVPGDARLSLEREPARGFDLLALDAFSGDAIPVHLLTREAFALYWRHLKPNGVLAVHVSNKYLTLAPVVALAARESGRDAVLISFDGAARTAESSSDWVLVTSRPGFLDGPAIRRSSAAIGPIAALSPWTDDFSNLYRLLR